MGRCESRQVRLGDVTIACDDVGDGERPILLVHGFTGSRDDWAEVVEPLAERTGRVVACDLRGHGESTNVGRCSAYDLGLLVDDLFGVLDALGIRTCDAIGHSLGGLIIAEACRRSPERFGSLMFMSAPKRPAATSVAGLLDGGSLIERFGAMRFAVRKGFTNRLALAGGMRMLAPFFVRSARVGPPAMRAAREAIGPAEFDARARAKILAMDPHAFVALGTFVTTFESIEPALRSIRCPTAVMIGEQDSSFLPFAREVLDELHLDAGDAELVIVPDAAHSPQIENTKAWLEAVVEHVARARRRPTTALGA